MTLSEHHDLLTRKFQLQREVLASWDRLHAAHVEHTRLMYQLQAVRDQLEAPNLFAELFTEA